MSAQTGYNPGVEYSDASTDTMLNAPGQAVLLAGGVAFGSTDRMSTVEARFWAKVDKSDGCWEWTGATRDGYGWFAPRHEPMGAHRFAWTMAGGTIPDGAYVLHHCDNRRCVRPSHLYIGTHADNMADVVTRKRARSPILRGERNGSSKLTQGQVVAIRARLAAGDTQAALAADFGVSRSLIGMIGQGKKWRHVPAAAALVAHLRGPRPEGKG